MPAQEGKQRSALAQEQVACHRLPGPEVEAGGDEQSREQRGDAGGEVGHAIKERDSGGAVAEECAPKLERYYGHEDQARYKDEKCFALLLTEQGGDEYSNCDRWRQLADPECPW